MTESTAPEASPERVSTIPGALRSLRRDPASEDEVPRDTEFAVNYMDLARTTARRGPLYSD